MKRGFHRIILVSVLLALHITGCSSANSVDTQPVNTAENDDGINIVTSFYPMYVLTLNVVKGIPGVSIKNMTAPQVGCLHDYQLAPADIKLLEGADIFVANGAGMESFMDKALKQVPGLKVVEASKDIDFSSISYNNGNSNSKEDVNPHVWVGISGAIIEVRNIGEQLASFDPENADKYRNNTQKYIEKLEAQKDKMHKALENVKTRNIATMHEAFPYFAKEFNLNITAIIESEPGSEPSAGQLTEIIKKVKQTKTKVIFTEPQYSDKSAETIARETGAKIYSLDPIVTGKADGNADAYIEKMDNNLKILIEALN